jgi:putative hemolysin
MKKSLAVIALLLLTACSVGEVQLTQPVVFCEFENEIYQPGEAITQPDGCDTCICSATGEIEGCTEVACEEPVTGLANPAAVKCLVDGLHYEIREDADGGQFGVCIDEANQECDGWEYFREECFLGENSVAVEEIPSPVDEVVDSIEEVPTATDSSLVD